MAKHHHSHEPGVRRRNLSGHGRGAQVLCFGVEDLYSATAVGNIAGDKAAPQGGLHGRQIAPEILVDPFAAARVNQK